ncbi:MAG: hypothetical protein AAGA23_09105 [Pseudomonadota bacterium]
MSATTLAIVLAAHIAVLGYWLGSELVINSTFRYVSYSSEMPLGERTRLLDHLMNVDQHVRYALVLQVALGTMLALAYGFFPGPSWLIGATAIAGLLWLAFVELVHRLRKKPAGKVLARIDRGSRYVLLLALLALAAGLVGGAWPLPDWLRWKLGALAGAVACGVGIRLSLVRYFRHWQQLLDEGPTSALNAALRRGYRQATGILIGLWVFLAIIAGLSILKPA